MSSTGETPTQKPQILVDTHGTDAGCMQKAGVGARSLADIKQSLETRTRPGQYDNSHNR
jgi:hypothetical protein